MSCAVCSSNVEKAVKGVKGTKNVSVNLLTNTLTLDGDFEYKDIKTAIVKAGYEIDEGETENNEVSLLKRRFLLSLVFSLPLMYLSMGHNMFNFPVPFKPVINGLMQMLLCIVVMIINRKFFINGLKAVLKRTPNMDTLVSMGSMASFLYSLSLIVDIQNPNLHDLYFESSAMILTLITMGKMLEAISKGKTTNAVKALTELAPSTATIIIDGEEKAVLASEVKENDIFVVRPGESLPVDGVIIEGESAINETMLTGESTPADKKAGDKVFAATINQSGFLKCRATKVKEETLLASIIKMVNDASGTKAPIARLADKISSVFALFVIIVAVIVFLCWMLFDYGFAFALKRAIAVLVISCPCALGLATPVAVMVGNGIGAKNNILFKNAEALEETGKAEVVVFDKTGTITEGTPRVTDVIGEEELIKIACTLEQKSEHPLAKAITDYAKQKGVKADETTDFVAHFGKGVSAKVGETLLTGGNYSFVKSIADIPDDLKQKADSLSESGKTIMFFAKDNKALGIIAVADKEKKDSKTAVNDLKKMGIKVVMLTGDDEKTAKAIADDVGIDTVISRVLPDEKEKHIRKLKENNKVIMVGDGINDAPALTSADIGIAIGQGTDIAIDAAQVILMKSDIYDTVKAIYLSRKVLKNIKENLFWAFIYNVISIPIAAGALYVPFGISLSPMLGAMAMGLSSVCVVSNALRLNLIKLNKKENKKMEKTMIIEGMMCQHCEKRVKDTLEAIAGVKEAIPSSKQSNAVVILEENVDDSVLKTAVENQGYTVKEII